MSDWASVVAFVPLRDTPGTNKRTGRPWRDTTGAFRPEAEAFLEASGTGEGRRDLLAFDNRAPMADRADEVLDLLASYRGQRRRIRCVAFFCHGWARGIQAGFFASPRRRNVEALAEELARVATPGVVVPLYACSTASSRIRKAPGGDGGFADELRDSLCRAGSVNCRVDAHITAGHTTTNPHVRRFEGGGSPEGGKGGELLVDPEDSDQWRRWRRFLGTPRRKQPGRLAFPWLDRSALEGRLEGV